MNGCVVILLGGPSGSGKSTLRLAWRYMLEKHLAPREKTDKVLPTHSGERTAKVAHTSLGASSSEGQGVSDLPESACGREIRGEGLWEGIVSEQSEQKVLTNLDRTIRGNCEGILERNNGELLDRDHTDSQEAWRDELTKERVQKLLSNISHIAALRSFHSYTFTTTADDVPSEILKYETCNNKQCICCLLIHTPIRRKLPNQKTNGKTQNFTKNDTEKYGQNSNYISQNNCKNYSNTENNNWQNRNNCLNRNDCQNGNDCEENVCQKVRKSENDSANKIIGANKNEENCGKKFGEEFRSSIAGNSRLSEVFPVELKDVCELCGRDLVDVDGAVCGEKGASEVEELNEPVWYEFHIVESDEVEVRLLAAKRKLLMGSTDDPDKLVQLSEDCAIGSISTRFADYRQSSWQPDDFDKDIHVLSRKAVIFHTRKIIQHIPHCRRFILVDDNFDKISPLAKIALQKKAVLLEVGLGGYERLCAERIQNRINEKKNNGRNSRPPSYFTQANRELVENVPPPFPPLSSRFSLFPAAKTG